MTIFGATRLPRSVLFGAGQRRAIGAVTASLGKRALICTDARLSADPAFETMLADLAAAGVETHIYDQTQPDLPIESIIECVDQVRDFTPDVVVGIGGGSCMDLSKVVAVLLAHGGEVSDYYGEFQVPGPVVPLVAVPTTAGTGSEVTPVAVVSDNARGIKIGIASPWLIPMAAICDPELTITCPPGLTACSGADAMTHAVEAFTTLARPIDAMLTQEHVFVGKNALSDHFARLAVKSIWGSLKAAYDNGGNVAAREELMLGALTAGCAFGTAGTAAAHALQYPVGNLTHTAHGDGVATLLPFVMQFNRPACAPAFAELARVVGLGTPDSSEAELSQLFIDGIAALFASVNIPKSLAQLGLAEDQQEYVAENSLLAARLIKNNPRPLDLDAMRRITQAAFAGDRARLLEGVNLNLQKAE
jgi:alcohol dehydrogenase class IV